MPVTIVTAFYPLAKCKRPISFYEENVAFICSLDVNMIAFVPESHSLWFRSRRDAAKTIIVERAFESFEMWSPEWRSIWQDTFSVDREKDFHSPELYAVWAMKQEFVTEAAKVDRFSTTRFVWLDVGYIRSQYIMEFVKTSPMSMVEELVPAGRMAMLQVYSIEDHLVRLFQERASLQTVESNAVLGGGMLVGDVNAWAQFSADYKAAVKRMHGMGMFVGKDQVVFVMMQIFRLTKRPFVLFETAWGDDGLHWLALAGIMSGTLAAKKDERFEQVDASGDKSLFDSNLEQGEHWSAPIVARIQSGAVADLFSECRRWVDWARQNHLKGSVDERGVMAILRQIVAKCPGVLLEANVVRPLLPFASFDFVVEWWIESGGRVDACSFLRNACHSLRFENVYPSLIRRVTNHEELFLLAVQCGNAAMIDAICRNQFFLSDETKRLAAAMVYSLECDDPSGTLSLLERYKLLGNVAVDDTMKQRFWARSDDEVKAAWLVKLEGAGITCMRPCAKVLLQPRVLEMVRRALTQ